MATIYGYSRISTSKQNIQRQIDNLNKFGVDKVYQEAYTGTKTTGRKELAKILKVTTKGDTIVFDSVSRMSRNSEEGTKLYFELMEKGINLVFLKERYIDTDVYKASANNEIDLVGDDIADEYIKATNNVFKIIAKRQIKIAFDQAEKEVNDLSQRTIEGLKVAKANGKKLGRPKESLTGSNKKGLLMKERLEKHHRAFGGTMTDKEFLEAFGGSKTTLVKYKKQLKSEM